MKVNEQTIISHVRIEDKNVQTNMDHQQGVAVLAKAFASCFAAEDYGEVLGLLHDKGKEQKDFQTYIRKVSGLYPNLIVASHPNHAYVGALLAQKLYQPMTPLLAYPIMGHHAGLYDFYEYEKTLKEKKIPIDVDCSSLNINLNAPVFKEQPCKYDIHHFIRMLFSCLVDADYLDTEKFMKPQEAALRTRKSQLTDLKSLLDAYLDNIKEKAEDTIVNQIRNQVQRRCLYMSDEEPGFYSLTVPTGGGKTLSSLVWAINHAIKNNKRRIIIAIPYTSIIVQTAETLRKIFGEENVLEHHSNTSIKDADVNETESDYALKIKLATENWDYPIIVTTNVQLFESIYSHKTSVCRKLHNICDSVIILDEAQAIPTDFLQPIVNALQTYKRLFGISVLFSTASQPIFNGQHRGCNPMVTFNGIEKVTEIIPQNYQLQKKLQRVKLHFDNDISSYDEIAKRIAEFKCVLCIVNTRKDAAEIYSRLPVDDNVMTIHLSRMMCPKHVSEKLKMIIESLKGKKNIRVISTQLIEAGVDIDFPTVFRQEAGLDSVLQAAGRCNREGKMKIGHTYVFRLDRPLPPGHLNRTNSARMDMMDIVEDKFSKEAMSEYFRFLYAKVNTFDKVDINQLLEKPMDLMFKTAGEKFKLIDDNTFSVIVNWKDSMELVNKLKQQGPSYNLMKKIAQYSVNIRIYDMNLLQQIGAVEEVLENIFLIRNTAFYNDDVGLTITDQWPEETLIC